MIRIELMKKSRVLKLMAAASVLLACTMSAFAQPTRIKGRVTDAETGEGIPFCGMFFKGTTIGVSTDLDGYYEIETREEVPATFCASILGYREQETVVSPHSYQELDFRLNAVIGSLNAAVVKPDDSRMRWILARIDEHRRRNDPERRKTYQCDIYTKMELDMTNADSQIRSKAFRKKFGFVFEYMDTSVISGQPYLPFMISETKSRRYHKDDPVVDKEVIEASRISGLDNVETAAQFTGNMHLKTNFYQNYINAFNVEIPSPLHPGGFSFYNYYLIDSLSIDGRNTWLIRFHPKKSVSTPVFDGEMQIDEQDFALRKIHAKLKKGSNINWIRDLVIDNENCMVGDSNWFYKSDKMYVDFSLTMRDSSKMVSVLGRREMAYSNPEFNSPLRREIAEAGDNVMVRKGAGDKDDSYWADARPYSLSKREQGIYEMVDSVKNVPIYRDIYTVVSTAIVGYFEVGKIGFGPVGKLYSFNSIEGQRFQFGARTTAAFNKKLRLTGYLAYGVRDETFKGKGSVEYVFNNQPTRKLTVTGRRDLVQLGKGSSSLGDNNLISSILTKPRSNRKSPINEYSVCYEHEWTPGINSSFLLEHRRIYSNELVPMVTPGGEHVNSVAATIPHCRMRLSWDETVTRGRFTKNYVHTDYPVVTIDLSGSVAGIARNDYDYFRSEVTIDYRLPLPPAGYSQFRFNGGRIIGAVPYPMLKLHEGNGTYFYDPTSFTCMDFYEFASDTWASLFWQHNFNGYFLGKIPLLRRAQLREVVTVNAAYGTLSERNNGIRGNSFEQNAVLLFPEGMSMLNKPYVEMGVGVTNIFRMLRLDATWRLTHRYKEGEDGSRFKAPHRFALTFGLELKF